MAALVSPAMETKSTGFLRLPRIGFSDLAGSSVAILGAAEASPYSFEDHSHSADAPKILREVSHRIAGSLSQFDFDLDMALLPQAGDSRGMVDLGDVPTDPTTPAQNRANITEALERVLAAGSVPIVLGGDDSVPIPVLAAYRDFGPVVVVQIDAHVDWADVIAGNPLGYGSPMRRVAEYPWVAGMVQVGIRGLGSGQSWQHDDARAWGSHLITSYELHDRGVDDALRYVPEGARVVLSLDLDGLDPAIFPAVNMPTPGGLRYEETIRLLRGLSARASIAGAVITEYVPEHDDKRRLSAQVAVRIIMALMASIIGPSSTPALRPNGNA